MPGPILQLLFQQVIDKDLKDKEIAKYLDVIVDGRYEDDLRNYFRIIAVRDFIGDSAKIVEAEESTAQE